MSDKRQSLSERVSGLTVTRRSFLKKSAVAGAAATALYVAPSMISTGAQRAFATGTPGVLVCALCDLGKPRSLTLKLLGSSVGTTVGNTQDGVSIPNGDADPTFPDPVYIRASNKSNSFDNKARVWFEGSVNLGATFDIDSLNGKKNNGDPDPKDNLDSTTYISYFDPSNVVAGQELQTVCFHTSCSRPLNLGDIFVSFEVVGFVSKDGLTADDCGNFVCAKNMKPGTLTMKFLGDSVGVNDGHSQADGKVAILNGTDPDPAFPNPVFIVTTGFSGEVATGGIFLIDGGGSKLASETTVSIYTVAAGPSAGTLLQRFKFHTSCSQPLMLGDRFVSIELLFATLVPK